MMTKSETKRIESKTREWDQSLRKFNIWCQKAWIEVKSAMNEIIDWYWFNNEKTKGGKAFHMIIWLLITRALIRLFWNV